MQHIRSLVFAAIFYPATAILSVLGLAAGAFGTAPARRMVRRWADIHHWLCDNLLGIRQEVEGAIPPGAHLIAVKHQSMYETIQMVRIADTPVVVLKRELTHIPLFGWITRRYGVIPVDRRAGAKALRQMVAMGRDAVAADRSVIIYPEGTRVPPGATPPLRSGFAGLYRALNLPVVPVAVDSGRLWGRGLVKRRGTIQFRVGETIPAGLKRDEIEGRVHAAINALELAP
ncbi:MAG TPA: lysophospholipid acyltransferase family protein [Sphingomicrobium sp.]|jgi:1-acyl-sn-glycerol-3-phosphate acyltransferase|nr:lysophospholipid acyltransferase family protein [Sphingomicrobium sp.]